MQCNSERREPPMMADSVNRILQNRKVENLVLSGDEEENPFVRLSDDLIVCHIFDKMPEAKCLLYCSLVCKRFSSLVYQASAISLILLPKKPNLANRIRGWTNNLFWTLFPRKVDGSRLLGERCDSKCCAQMILFLSNFKALKYVNIEFDIFRKLRMEPVIKWRLDSQSDSLVMLFVKNLDSGARVSGDIIRSYLLRALTRLSVIDWELDIVELVSSKLTELKGVVFTDAEKQGTLILDEKAILCIQNPTSNYREFSMRTWYAPKLELPSSGHVMEDVMLFVFKGEDMVDDFLIAEKLGEGKEKIYSEAAVEMLKKEAMYRTVGRNKIFSFWQEESFQLQV